LRKDWKVKTQLGPSGILFPVPASLVVSGSLEEPNSITVAWIGMMSSSPPTGWGKVVIPS